MNWICKYAVLVLSCVDWIEFANMETASPTRPGKNHDRILLLRLVLLSLLCWTQGGCTDTSADKALVDSVGANAYIGRGGPRNGHDFVVYSDVLAKWVREIPEIPNGTPVDEVIRRLGEPDYAYVNAPELSWSPHADRIAVYSVVMDRTDKSAPVTKKTLVDVESIDLVFDSDGRYKSYLVNNPLHANNYGPFDADQDLASLLNAGPAATAP